MTFNRYKSGLALALVAAFGLMSIGADDCGGAEDRAPKSSSGVTKATAKVKTNAEGLSVEQEGIRDRLLADNTPGSIKHVYVISAYSGQVIMYSTARHKVFSGGKRLSPATVAVGTNGDFKRPGFNIDIGGQEVTTSEVLGDDGAYGSSGDYVYWFDSKGTYHQHYMTGGQIFHVSSEPMAVKSVIINVESKEVGESTTPTTP